MHKCKFVHLSYVDCLATIEFHAKMPEIIIFKDLCVYFPELIEGFVKCRIKAN